MLIHKKAKKVYVRGPSRLVYHPEHGYGFISDAFGKAVRWIFGGNKPLPEVEKQVEKLIQNPQVKDAKEFIQEGMKDLTISDKKTHHGEEVEVDSLPPKAIPVPGIPKEPISVYLSKLLESKGSGLRKKKSKMKDRGEGLYLPGTFGSGLVTL